MQIPKIQPHEGIGLRTPRNTTLKMQIQNIRPAEDIIVGIPRNANPRMQKYQKFNPQKASVLGFPETKPPECKYTNTPRRHRCQDSQKRTAHNTNTPQNATPRRIRYRNSPKRNPQEANTQNATPRTHKSRDSPKNRNPQNAN